MITHSEPFATLYQGDARAILAGLLEEISLPLKETV